MNCPICNSESKEKECKVDTSRRLLSECLSCGHIFTLDLNVDYSNRGIDAFKNNCNFQGIKSMQDGFEWNDFCQSRLKKLFHHNCINMIKELNIIEIGCMEGNVLYRLSEACHKVIGYEPNKEVAKNHPFIKPIKFDDDNIEPETVDLIYSFHVLEHLPHPVITMEKIYNALAPGGHVFIETPLNETDYFNMDHLHFFTYDSIYELFVKNNLKNIKVEVDKYTNYNNIEYELINISGKK